MNGNMTDADILQPRVSRRMWLAGLGGGMLAAPFFWGLGMIRGGRQADAPHGDEAACCAYVDRDGWMLTPEDAAALASRPPAP